MSNTDELLDLVNDNDEIIGTIWRSEYDKLLTENIGNIRAVDLFLQNSKGEIWIPKRTAHKKIAPNGLDYSAGGHVSSGETYTEAMVKEISEELNLDLASEDLELLGKLGPNEHKYIREIYLYRTNLVPEYNTEDFVSADWVSVDDLIALLESRVPAKESILPTVKHFYDKLAR